MALVRADFGSAVCDYEYKRDSVKLLYIMRAYKNSDWRPDIGELTDSIKAISEVIVSESFDWLYDEYSDGFVERVFYANMKVDLANKEELHRHFVSQSVSHIIDGMCRQIKTNKILTPTEDDIREFLEKNTKIEVNYD